MKPATPAGKPQKEISMKQYLMAAVVAAGLAAASASCAQTAQASAAADPVMNISAARYGNLAAAQSYSRQAYERLTMAQMDHRYRLGGHANRAKDLLRQANFEMKLAAQSIDRPR
jgi:hypothetical protein